jgi:hypothetical protein
MQPGSLLLLLVIRLVHAAFNQTTGNSTWSGNNVQPNEAGTFCYFPAANQTNATFCSGGHSESTSFQPVLNIHLHLSEGWSIAYYSANNALLGNQSYPVIANTETVQCLSGQAGDGTYQTLCMGIDYDNNIAEAGSYCLVKLGQTYVSDGCYSAMPNTTSTASQPASTSSTSTKPSSVSSTTVTNPLTFVIPIVVGIMGLFGSWSVAYCTNPWCRQQTNQCCCICGRRESFLVNNY